MDNSHTNDSFNSNESCISYANPQTGELLFYSNGKVVYNKENRKMPNGGGLLENEKTLQPSPSYNGLFLNTMDKIDLESQKTFPTLATT